MKTKQSIQTLPPEILARIFVKCLPSNASARLDSTQAPILLCRVCSWWSTIAIAEHALWDTVIFLSGWGSHSASTRFIQDGHVDRWFDRAGPNRRLSLGQEDGNSGIRLEEYIPLITKYAARLRHISIVLPRVPDRSYLVDKLPKDVVYPELEALSIFSTTVRSNLLQGNTTMPTPFNTAPKLREVALALHNFPILALELPWLQLTKVTLLATRGMDANEWLAVFDACPNMLEGVLPRPWKAKNSPPTLTFTSPSASYDPLRRSHNALKSLTLLALAHWDRSGGDWYVFEKFIDFPSLEHLELHSPERGGSFAAKELVFTCAQLKTFWNLQSLVFGPSESPTFLVEAMDSIRLMITDPEAFETLLHLTIPWEACEYQLDLLGIAALLESRPPTEEYPGLRVDVTGVPKGERSVQWHSRVARLPRDIAKRLRIFGSESS